MRISDWSSDVCSSDLRNRALRWRLPSLFRTTPAPTSAAHGRKSARLVLLLRYSLMLNIVVSDREVAGNAQMPAHDIDELRIALRGPYGRKMTGRPDCKSDQPKTQAETEGGRESAIEDRNRTRRAAEQDMLGQGGVPRHRKSRHLCSMVGRHRHQTSAPRPRERKARKKIDAK